MKLDLKLNKLIPINNNSIHLEKIIAHFQPQRNTHLLPVPPSPS